MIQNSPDSALALRRMPKGRICLSALAACFSGAPLWTLPTLTLNASASAALSNLGSMGAHHSGLPGNQTTSWLWCHGFGVGACLLFFASCHILGGVGVSFVRISGWAAVPLNPPQSRAL